MQHKSVSINALRDTFFSRKLNESQEYDEINFNVIKNHFSELSVPLKRLFSLSSETELFPDKLKIVRVTSVYKAGDIVT